MGKRNNSTWAFSVFVPRLDIRTPFRAPIRRFFYKYGYLVHARKTDTGRNQLFRHHRYASVFAGALSFRNLNSRTVFTCTAKSPTLPVPFLRSQALPTWFAHKYLFFLYALKISDKLNRKRFFLQIHHFYNYFNPPPGIPAMATELIREDQYLLKCSSSQASLPPN